MSTIAANRLTNFAKTLGVNVEDLVELDNKMLSPLAANPSTRQDGSPLVVGDTYFNTASKSNMTYDGSIWTKEITSADIVDTFTSTDATKVLSAARGKALYDLLLANNATIIKYSYTLAVGQTVVSGADLTGKVLAYVPNAVLIVTLNGYSIDITKDYTATNGTSLVLVDPVNYVSDISITVFGSFTVANHYTKPEIDALLSPNQEVYLWAKLSPAWSSPTGPSRCYWDTPAISKGGITYDSSGGNNQFIVPIGGVYRVLCNVLPNSSGTGLTMGVDKAGVGTTPTQCYGQSLQTTSMQWIGRLGAGDRVWATLSTGTLFYSADGVSTTHHSFSIERIDN